MFGPSQAMIYVILSTGQFEGMRPETFTLGKSFFNIRSSRTLVAWGGEVGSVVGQNSVDFVWKSLN